MGNDKTNAPLNYGVLATFRVDPDLLGKMKAIAFWEGKSRKDTINEVFQNYITEYESRNGEVQLPKPLA